MTVELTVLVSIVTGLGGFLISYFKWGKARDKDMQSEGRQDGVMLTELGYIKANTEDIKSEQKEQRKINTEVYERLASVESSAKQAHHRLDQQNDRINHFIEVHQDPFQH